MHPTPRMRAGSERSGVMEKRHILYARVRGAWELVNPTPLHANSARRDHPEPAADRLAGIGQPPWRLAVFAFPS